MDIINLNLYESEELFEKLDTEINTVYNKIELTTDEIIELYSDVARMFIKTLKISKLRKQTKPFYIYIYISSNEIQHGAPPASE